MPEAEVHETAEIREETGDLAPNPAQLQLLRVVR
jgi:hypothetical protein